MGKRELLLVLVFVIVGAVVYQATAPPPEPGTRGFSLSHLIEAARREVRGNRARVEIVRADTLPIGPEITEIRIVGTLSEVELVGTDGQDVETELTVVSNGYDEAEAKRYGEETVLTADRSASGLTLKLVYPEGRHTGIQRGMLALKIPARLRVRVESRTGKLQVRGVAAVEATNAGGTTTIKQIAGRVTVTQRGGRISIEEAATVKFTGRSAEATITGVTGDASFTLEGGGELTATRLGGPIDVEARNAEVSLDRLEDSPGPIRINAVNGSLRLAGTRAEARIDSRNADVEIAMAGPAPMTIHAENGDVALTPPPGGYQLDAVIVEGQVEPRDAVDRLGLTHQAGEDESRASGAVNGGGPTITVRTTRGNLRIQPKP